MLDINYIRENKEKVKQAQKNRGNDVDIDKILELDEKRRALIKQVEELRHQRNVISAKDADRDKAKQIKEDVKQKEEELKTVEQEFNALMLNLHNIPLDNVPVGKDEDDNVVLEKKGRIHKIDKPKDHIELGEQFDLIDIKRAAKVSGARFSYLKNEAAMLQMALIRFSFDFLVKKGFVPLITPVMIKPDMALGMGYIEQSDEQEAFYLPKDDLYLIGTAEQIIGTMHANEVLEDLPKRYVGFSTCFRREAGSYGKDTKGILRVHQFDKIEMFSFCKPDDSDKEHEYLLSLEQEMMDKLKIPYQVVQMCTGDLGRPSANTYDIESWMPGQDKYRETHSSSNCTDFQARRLNIKTKDKKFVHTLNATAFAIGRTLIAILENNQTKNGIKIPKALQKYVNFKVIS